MPVTTITTAAIIAIIMVTLVEHLRSPTSAALQFPMLREI
jgi:hypothetical protein